MASKNFSSKEVVVDVLITELRDFFETKNYKIDYKQGTSGAIILDTNKAGKPYDFLGLSLRVTVRLNSGSEVTRIWIGNQKWVDKVIVGFVGLVLFVCLRAIYFSYSFSLLELVFLLLKLFSILVIVLPAVGAYLQYKVTQDVWNMIEDHVALRSTVNL
ncbi:hypothetical protein LC605_18920 [Nostoc sp. CHAB 5836]|uniref:hypothetical protein n=1 Tax=Nostoc sp. CHAB 5836 TaxID=2780404 RepID=UPI001E3A4966|nr:hypothetical protein [Nostoc sp. CHAB 5836]MCC5617114.1 hypothetical protein [Nostoc sp. CHAB 5836]